jgi:branched-subunit amino acid transport protein
VGAPRGAIVSDAQTWWLIAGMAAITLLLRASFIVLPRIRLPAIVERALAYVPAAVLAGIVAPAIVTLSPDTPALEQLPRWIAAAVGIAIALRTRLMIAVLLGGMATLWAVQALLR